MHISINKDNVQGYFPKDSEVMVEQITILDKRSMAEVDKILYKHLGLAAPLGYDQEDDKAGDPS